MHVMVCMRARYQTNLVPTLLQSWPAVGL